MSDDTVLNERVVLITGAAHRIGATIATTLHAEGMKVVLHYRNSASAARALAAELNAARPDSVVTVQGDLLDIARLPAVVEEAANAWGHIDVLVNNASTFYPTQVGEVNETQWEELIGSNLKAPFFLAQAAAPHLRQAEGCIVNIVDIHADRPLKGYPVYSIAKAGLVMLTKALAKELGPAVRVNAVAPGAILWPENANELDSAAQQEIISRTALKRRGEPMDIARAVRFLVRDALYMSGQVLTVDGGRTLHH